MKFWASEAKWKSSWTVSPKRPHAWPPNEAPKSTPMATAPSGSLSRPLPSERWSKHCGVSAATSSASTRCTTRSRESSSRWSEAESEDPGPGVDHAPRLCTQQAHHPFLCRLCLPRFVPDVAAADDEKNRRGQSRADATGGDFAAFYDRLDGQRIRQ